MKNSKIKICHVANTDKTVTFFLLPQLQFLQKQGFLVHVVCAPGALVKEIQAKGIKVKTITVKRKISPLHDLVSLFLLWSYFKKERFDMVHVHNPKPGLLGQLAARLAGVPIVINTIHGLYFTEDSPYIKKTFFVSIEKIAALCSDLIFSQSKEDVDTLVKEQIAPREKIKDLGNGVDISIFNPDRFSKTFIVNKKKELHIPDDFKVVGIVARLVKEKGYLDLFEAFRTVLKSFPKTMLLVIGPKEPGKKDAIDLQVINDYGIEKNVILLGERNDVVKLYPLMDIFVLPSHREGLPRSILEAMAEKRPVIATNIRGCREEIENGKSGVLVPIKNPKTLAEAMILLLQNPRKARQLGQAARIRVQKHFNEDFVFDKIKQGYQELIQKKLPIFVDKKDKKYSYEENKLR